MRPSLPALPWLALLALSGCAGAEESFPSLQPRAIEKIDIAGEPAVTAAPAVALDTEGAKAVASAFADAEAGDRSFLEAARSAEPAVRAATRAVAGSDAWLAGQQALSRVQAAMLATADALQALDSQRLAAGEIGPAPALEEAWGRASALDASHRAEFNRLSALLLP